MVVTRGWGEERVGNDCLMSTGSPSGLTEHVLELDRGDGCITLSLHNQKSLYSTLKMGEFMTFKFYLNNFF